MGPANTTASITTADQLLKAGDIGRCELVRGELIMMSPAGALHGRIAMKLGLQIGAHVEKHKLGGVFAAETGFVLERDPDTVRAPDVAFVRTERLKQIPKRGFFPGAPDLAVEVLSPDDTAGEVLAKVQQWLDAGAIEVWVADPDRRTISIHRSTEPVRVLRHNAELSGGDLLPGLAIKLDSIFD